MADVDFYRGYLKNILAERCDRNPRYSVRAFARAIEIDVGALSRVMAGKQIPSFKLSQKILKNLELRPDDSAQFLESVMERQKARNLKRLSPILNYRKNRTPSAALWSSMTKIMIRGRNSSQRSSLSLLKIPLSK
jgi:transcriptional regulator with XRE-family HTH domain